LFTAFFNIPARNLVKKDLKNWLWLWHLAGCLWVVGSTAGRNLHAIFDPGLPLKIQQKFPARLKCALNDWLQKTTLKFFKQTLFGILTSQFLYCTGFFKGKN